MKDILLFVGTRPDAIKLAPLVFALRARGDEFKVTVCSTSQHNHMLQQAMQWFELQPDEDLQIMRQNQQPGDVVAAALAGANELLRRCRPDIVIVQGDTATATAAALAGFYADVPVAHVEAGLRSHDRRAPWPEEVNRIMISRLATWHFAVTEKNAAILQAEKADGHVHVVGNTVLDALLYMQDKIKNDPAAAAAVRQAIMAAGYPLAAQKRFILVTGHRRESFGRGMENICQALQTIAQKYPALDIVYAVHLNPQVKTVVHQRLAASDNIYLLPPLDYAAFVYLMSRCYMILTDSGGIQEEAPTLNKPLLVMRTVTERPEVIACGAGRLTGTDTAGIVGAADEVLNDEAVYRRMAAAVNPFGDGRAAQYIAGHLARPAP